MEQKTKSVFETLSAIDLSGKVEKKGGLSYLPWAHAWAAVKRIYPNTTYKVHETTEDSSLGFMCHTSVTIEGETLDMWLPVMDGENKVMKRESYTFRKGKWEGGKKVYYDASVEPATGFDINKTIMRCLVKNLAMFGLGINIYAGEDLPLVDDYSEVNTATGISNSPTTPNAGVSQSAPPAESKNSGIMLKKGSDNWNAVLKYVANNRDKSYDDVHKQLTRKYVISAVLKSELKNIHEAK
jgi:hypothetical protein